MSLTPTSSPFAPPSAAFQPANQEQRQDMLLHRVLDKNYRLQATPHAQPRSVHRTAQTPKQGKTKGKYRESTSPMSSPPIPAPQLHREIFSSPQRRPPPRTPGVSVLTPAAKRTTGPSKTATNSRGWDSDSDDADDSDGLLDGMSPPKTMQFHVPQSRLLQTPGKSFDQPHYLRFRLTNAICGTDSPRSKQTHRRGHPPHSRRRRRYRRIRWRGE